MITKRDLILGLLVITIWAANAIAIKFITNEVEPFTGLSLRFILAAICFFPFLRWPGREKFWRLMQIVFLLAVLHWGSLIWAIDKLEASMASILIQTQIIFTVLLGRFFFHETFGWRTGAGIALGIVGVIILVGLPQTPPDPLGVAGMIFTTLAISIAYARMKGLSDIAPTNYIAHLHIFGFFPALMLAYITEDAQNLDFTALNWGILVPALAFQAFLVSFAHMLWQRLIARNAMSVLPNLTLLIPFLGVGFAVILLDESLTLSMVLGGILTTAGVAIIMIRKQKSQSL